MNELREHLRDVFQSAGMRLTSQRCLVMDVLEANDSKDNGLLLVISSFPSPPKKP